MGLEGGATIRAERLGFGLAMGLEGGAIRVERLGFGLAMGLEGGESARALVRLGTWF